MSQNSKNKKAEDFNVDDYINPQKGLSNSTAPIEQPLGSETTVNTKPTDNTVSEKESLLLQSTKKAVSSKQRKAGLSDYQQTFLSVPKITDRKTVFISNELREKIVGIVRKLGTEKSSVSGFVENLVTQHLEEYKEDVESWKKL